MLEYPVRILGCILNIASKMTDNGPSSSQQAMPPSSENTKGIRVQDVGWKEKLGEQTNTNAEGRLRDERREDWRLFHEEKKQVLASISVLYEFSM